MYRAYYRLQKNVNHKDIAVKDLFNSTGYNEARARLDYMKDKRGLVLVSGLSGVGKTTLLRSFAESLDPKFFKIDYVPLSTVSVNDFYRQLADLLSGQTLYKKDILFRTIQQAILEMAVKKKSSPSSFSTMLISSKTKTSSNCKSFPTLILTPFRQRSLF